MSKKQLKITGIVCLILCAICLFAAVERYNANAGKVRFINSAMPEMFGGGNVTPGIPVVTKYAVFFAVLTGIGGGISLMKSR